jgi:hypothetical protein
MATAKKAGKKLNSTEPKKAFTRSPKGERRQLVAVRFTIEELNALDAMAEDLEINFSEAVRVSVREKLAKEKILIGA